MRIGLKDKVLTKLSKNKGTYYSGQELADEFGVTRAAVWKAIKVLRKAGYTITGTNNKGYSIESDNDVVDAANISGFLSDEAKTFYRVLCMETTPSTNLEVKNHATDGEQEGLVVISEEQTKGRGRMGRSFLSPKGSGIYLSVLLRPSFSSEEAAQVTVAAASAAALAIEKACPSIPEGSIQIKWVNDLYLNAHKICGILTEASVSLENTGLEYVILGIGFNILDPNGGWPDELKDIAGSLADYDIPASARVRIAAEFLNFFLPMYQNLSKRTHMDEYRRRQMLLGKTVEIISVATSASESNETASVLGVDDDGHLIVRLDKTGETVHLNSGEVRVRKNG